MRRSGAAAWCAQVVTEHGGEHLVQAQGFLQLRVARVQLLLLPMQLVEHLRLAAQDVRVHRLVEEIHGTGFIAAEMAERVARNAAAWVS